MMSETETSSTGVSMEETPSGEILPEWLLKALISGHRLMIIYPSEESRKLHIQRLHDSESTGLIDTTLHITLKRLVSILHLDLRLPSVLEDDGILLERVHEGLKKASKEFRLLNLLSNPSAIWTRSKTKRLLTLYKEISSLSKAWSWEDDPGAKVCDEVLIEIGKELNSTHPLRVEREVLKALQSSDTAPFTISDIDGVIMLDHPTGISEIRLELLSELSRFTGVHQLVNPGSHRLGYHGEFIHDISPIANSSDLPNWVPNHEVKKTSLNDNYVTEIGHRKNTSIHRLTVENESFETLALASVIPKLKGSVLVISGDPDRLTDDLQIHLRNLGINTGRKGSMLIENPAISRVLEIMKISSGEEAWSLSKLTDISSQLELPIDLEFDSLVHPVYENWKPKLHLDIMTEVARGFHLLGGKGALSRWLATLSQATPRPGVDQEKRMQELEECQWWLVAFSNWLHPILPKHDQEMQSEFFLGCSSGEMLPLPELPTDIISWFNSLANLIDWSALSERIDFENTSIKSLQVFFATITKFTTEGFEFNNEDLIEICSSIVENTELSGARGSDDGLKILSFSQAYGLDADTIILCGIDSTKWSMKCKSIPWLDENVRMKLGLHKPDEPLRIGRHQLRHILNSARTVLILDSTIEEGIEFSGPIDEWIHSISQEGNIDQLNSPPEFISSEEWHPDTENREWEWKIIDGETRLVFRVNSMEVKENHIITHRSGNLPRDHVQRSGISSIENRIPRLSPMNAKGMLFAAEREVISDQIDRRISGIELEEGEAFGFENSPNLIITSKLKLLPGKRTPANGRNAENWPHLGFRDNKNIGIAIDPRPITPPTTTFDDLDSILGRSSLELKAPKVWSQGRLQSWLDCPRKAWYERHKYVSKDEKMREDLAAITRGDIVHQVEETVLQFHGIKPGTIFDESVPLHLGPLKDIEVAWKIALDKVKQSATWMKRIDGIAAHRCRDLVGISPLEWRDFLETDVDFPIGGRIGRMLLADYELTNASPIACEWEIYSENMNSVQLSLPELEKDFSLMGRVDRVDRIDLFKEYLDEKSDQIIPLDFDLETPPACKRFVVIRDIKSVDGTKDNGDEKRHMNAIFKELQLALYARAWEICNPGDRVIGVGVTTVGNNTKHRIELDPEFIDDFESLCIGEITNYTHDHYRLPGEESETSSNAFRAWLRERITTAFRVIEGLESGNIHPEPSTEICKYCSIADACPSAKKGDA